MTGKRPARNDEGKTKMKTKLTASEKATKKTNEAFEVIAQRILGIDTLAVQLSDRLDFHEVGVWNIKAALQAAYELGRDSK
jgi:hypothetical protein